MTYTQPVFHPATTARILMNKKRNLILQHENQTRLDYVQTAAMSMGMKEVSRKISDFVKIK
jgi:hypothetical protein